MLVLVLVLEKRLVGYRFDYDYDYEHDYEHECEDVDDL